jgi:hypothetical protein
MQLPPLRPIAMTQKHGSPPHASHGSVNAARDEKIPLPLRESEGIGTLVRW